MLDAAILLSVISGYDPADPASLPIPGEDFLATIREGVAGWRIALASDEYFQQVDPQVQAAVEAAARTLELLGARIERVDFPEAHQAAQANALMVTSDAAAFHRERLQSHPQGFGADVLQRLRSGAAFTSTEYILSRRTQAVCVKKIPYTNVLVEPGTAFEVLDKSGDFTCNDSGAVVDGKTVLTCFGKELFQFDLKLTNTTCGGSALQTGSGQCQDGFGFDAAQQCCAPVGGDAPGSVVVRVELGACPLPH